MAEQLGPYWSGKNNRAENGIYIGDSFKLAELVPDQSVGMIFTDPVYDDFGQYTWLAGLANRVLLPGRVLFAYYGIGWAPETFEAIKKGGRPYTWHMGEYQPGPRRGSDKHFAHQHALGWFGGKPLKTIADFYLSDNDYGSAYKHGDAENHKWRKPLGPIRKWIRGCTKPGEIVLDPFAGGGSILEAAILEGRGYLGFEINPVYAERARIRLRKAVYKPMLADMDEIFVQADLFAQPSDVLPLMEFSNG